MKKVIAVIMLACAMLVGGMAADAKTTSKKKSGKARTSQSVTFGQYPDGYADITGHTYTTTFQGDKANVRFGRDGMAYWSDPAKGNKTQFTTYWSYQGGGIVSCFGDDGSMAIDFQISNGGKELLSDMYGQIVTWKLVK